MTPSSPSVDSGRITRLNDLPARDGGGYVLYWMQQSQRVEDNHALAWAVQLANERGQGVVVCFGLTASYPDANLRHYHFMLEGLRDVERRLRECGIAFVVRQGEPFEVAVQLASDASLVVADRGYLRHQRRWRDTVAEEAGCAVYEVETDAIVPVETVSEKQEFAARTIRKKLWHWFDRFAVDVQAEAPAESSLDMDLAGIGLDSPDTICDDLGVNRSVQPVDELFRGGAEEARRVLRAFIDQNLPGYAQHRNQPQTDDVSHMSKYLHFGQISPVFVASAILDAAVDESTDAFIEELLVRRELAINYVFYNENYDSWEGLPDWAKKTLAEHRGDEREYVYDEIQLVHAETHDPYWNAAMREMRETGYMHNYMRMYWGKKILEWTADPEEAYAVALRLNNRYFIDGRDPNSYAGVGWIFGLHDRPWQERPVFGKTRYMSASGLERKADPDAYIEKVASRAAAAAKSARPQSESE